MKWKKNKSVKKRKFGHSSYCRGRGGGNSVETVRKSGIFNNYSTSACWIWVGYNHLISEIIVLLKTPAKYREFFPTLCVKTTDFQLVFKFEQTRTVTLISSLVTPPLPTFLESTLEIELELHKWEASARSQLLHSCSLLLSNCKIISTLIITLECNNYMLHCNNWYSKMKLNNFIIPLYCCDSKSNFCAGFFFALKWNKLLWAGYLVESMTSVSGVNMHHWPVNFSCVESVMVVHSLMSVTRPIPFSRNPVRSHALCELCVM